MHFESDNEWIVTTYILSTRQRAPVWSIHPASEKGKGCPHRMYADHGGFLWGWPPCRHEAWSRSALPHASSHSCRRDRASPDGRARSVLCHPGVQANLSFPGPSSRRLIQPLGFLVVLAGIVTPAGAYLGSTTFYTPKSRCLAHISGHSAQQKARPILCFVLPRSIPLPDGHRQGQAGMKFACRLGPLFSSLIFPFLPVCF